MTLYVQRKQGKMFDQVYHNFFDIIGEQFKERAAFPFYNIIKTSDTQFEVQIALSGYTMDDIKITLEGDHLIISSVGLDDNSVEYVHKGFTTKSFARSFVLNNDVVIDGANFNNGVLVISMSRMIPEQAKVKNIPINNRTQLNG